MTCLNYLMNTLKNGLLCDILGYLRGPPMHYGDICQAIGRSTWTYPCVYILAHQHWRCGVMALWQGWFMLNIRMWLQQPTARQLCRIQCEWKKDKKKYRWESNTIKKKGTREESSFLQKLEYQSVRLQT